MTDKKLDKQLSQLGKKHQKARELLEGELGKEREQAGSARSAQEEAQAKLSELEARRPQLAASIFSGASGAGELEAIDEELRELRQAMEIAALAEEQAGKRAQEIEGRLFEVEHEAAERRYDLYAGERKEGVAELEDTLDSLTSQLDALLEIDRLQRLEEQNLGLGGGDMSYAELLDGHLRVRLAGYIPEAARSTALFDQRARRETLLEKDRRVQTRGEARAQNEAEVERLAQQAAQHKRASEDWQRLQAYKYRRAEIRALYGLLDRQSPDTPRVAAVLKREFPDLFAAEEQAELEAKKQGVRSTLLGPGEDYAALSEERRAEVDAAVEEWVADKEEVLTTSG